MLIRRRDAEAGADADAETQMKINFEAGGSSTDAARTQHGRSTDAARTQHRRSAEVTGSTEAVPTHMKACFTH